MAERKRRWTRPAAAAILILTLAAALTGVFWVNTHPYTPQGARRLYERHRAAYDEVGKALLQAGEGCYWINDFADFPKEIAGELNETLWAGRWGTDGVRYSELGICDTPAVLFYIYMEEFDSGDGSRGRKYQYLAYIPEAGGLAFFNAPTAEVAPVTEYLYLYIEIVR